MKAYYVAFLITYIKAIGLFFQVHLGIALSVDHNFSRNKLWFCYFDLRIGLIN